MDSFEAYVLSQYRSASTLTRFLNSFAPHRACESSEFQIPEYAETPSVKLNSCDDLISYLERHVGVSYSLYWTINGDALIRQVMAFFTYSGDMIVGVAANNSDPASLLECVAKAVDGQFGFITSESAPPFDKSEFIDICRSSSLPAIIDGRLVSTR